MPPKKTQKKAKEDLNKKTLKAVVVTDDFETKFMPLTATTPRCLLTLANVPLIEYTLEFLANSEVSQVYLYCCGTHSDQVQNYIKNSKWVLPWSPFKITCLKNLDARSVGDVMRDLDDRSLVSDDFVLVSGDVITNINLRDALDHHKKIKAADKDHIVTMIMTEASATNKSRPYSDDPAVVLLEEGSHKCLYFDNAKSSRSNLYKKEIQVDFDSVTKSNAFEIRNDLIDCRIDICTPGVPAIYQENFDFQHCRGDFVRQILQADLLERTIYVYVAPSYAARVSSYMTYKSITKNVLQRFVYPIVPELNFYDNYKLKYETDHIYKDDTVVLAQSCKVGASSLIGTDSFIGANSVVDGVVVGSNVKIGAGCTIKNTIIFNDVVIEDDVEIDNAIIGEGVVIKNKAVVKSGAVVGKDCVVEQAAMIVENTKLIKQDEETITYSEEGFSDSDDESCYSDTATIYRLKSLSLSDDSISSMKRRKSSSKPRKTGRSASTFAKEMSPEQEFDEEAYATLERAIDNDHDLDTAVLEINTLRMSLNVDYSCVRRSTMRALIAKIMIYVDTNTLDVEAAVEKIMSKWVKILTKQVFTPMDQVHLLSVVNELCLKEIEKNKSNGEKLQLHVLDQLYDSDVCEEDCIRYWYEKEKDKVKNGLVERFVEWLENAEEESEEEDDDEE